MMASQRQSPGHLPSLPLPRILDAAYDDEALRLTLGEMPQASEDIPQLRRNPLPPLATVAAAPVKQILISLIRNAAETLQEGGIVVGSTAAGLSEHQHGFVAVTVEDSGPGTPAEIINRLLSPAASTKDSIHAGFGLSITKRLIKELSGTITCDSRPWDTRFRLLIPNLRPYDGRKIVTAV
ncbi:MAG TPA: ATP-binding protein [Gammaproteobacteria bacterium]|nr:ATP-binding protein [Gammaproteobacteria bacterium]